MERKQNLTDSDVDAIVEKLEAAMMKRFQMNVGKGVITIAWKWIIVAIVALAGYGAAGGFKKWGA